MLAFVIAIPAVRFAYPGCFAERYSRSTRSMSRRSRPVPRQYRDGVGDLGGARHDYPIAWPAARQLGILLATGPLIPNAMAGPVLSGCDPRPVVRSKGRKASGPCWLPASSAGALYGLSGPYRAANRRRQCSSGFSVR